MLSIALSVLLRIKVQHRERFDQLGAISGLRNNPGMRVGVAGHLGCAN